MDEFNSILTPSYLDHFYSDFFDYVLLVNLSTGHYKFVKCDKNDVDDEILNGKDISWLINNFIQRQKIHPDDITNCKFYTDHKNILEKIKRKQTKISYTYRQITRGNRGTPYYIWITFDVIVPKDFSDDNPFVLFTWRSSDITSNNMNYSLMLLNTFFYKVLKINLTSDNFEIIRKQDSTGRDIIPESNKISEWMETFGKNGEVYDDDLQTYLEFVNIERLRNFFASGNSYAEVKYRRKVDGIFRWVSMEIIPTMEYTHENQTAMLYTRDIHETYSIDMAYKEKLEFFSYTDVLTNLKNRTYYERYIEEISDSGLKLDSGLLYCDLNNLKFRNDTFGHDAGDHYIREFADMLTEFFPDCIKIRLSGDEFLVLSKSGQLKSFMPLVQAFDLSIHTGVTQIASIGYDVWHENSEKIEEALKRAEKKMYADKNTYYEKNGIDRRRR